MSEQLQKFHILGLGAIGGLLAIRLTQQHSVCALLRNRPSALELNTACNIKSLNLGYRQAGILPNILPVASAAIDWQLAARQVPISKEPKNNEPINNLLITTKSFQARPALESVLARVNSKTRIVLMQNGLGSQFQLAKLFPNHRLFAATTTEAANCQQNGSDGRYKVINHAATGITRVGAITSAADRGGCEALLSAVNTAGLSAFEEADIWQALWQKFSVSCGINAYTAIIGCRNGAIVNHDLFNRTISELCEELAKLLSTAGYPESAVTIEQRIRNVAKATSNNISSMLQDIRAGRQTEIDAINGFAVQYAQQNGFSVPVNAMLTKKMLNASN